MYHYLDISRTVLDTHKHTHFIVNLREGVNFTYVKG